VKHARPSTRSLAISNRPEKPWSFFCNACGETFAAKPEYCPHCVHSCISPTPAPRDLKKIGIAALTAWKRFAVASLVILIAVTVGGCNASPAFVGAANQLPPAITWSDLDNGDALWFQEASKRFRNPLIFSCHGGTRLIGGKATWVCFPDDPSREILPVEDVAKVLHNLYPHRDLVLICCNAGHLRINVPRVYYATDIVWSAPQPIPFNLLTGERCVGSINEFVTGAP